MEGLVVNGFFGPILTEHVDPQLWAPKVKVSLISPTWDRIMMPQIVANDLTAMIDTGSSMSCLDSALASRFGFQPSSHGKLTGFENPVELPGYNFAICLDGTLKIYIEHGPSRAFRAEGSDFDVILGWSFLQHYALTASKKSNTVRLEWGK